MADTDVRISLRIKADSPIAARLPKKNVSSVVREALAYRFGVEDASVVLLNLLKDEIRSEVLISIREAMKGIAIVQREEIPSGDTPDEFDPMAEAVDGLLSFGNSENDE